jgi:monooxygenase
MDKHHHDSCQPVLPVDDMETDPLINFKSSYVLRSLDKMPRQGHTKPWKLNQNYILDRISLKYKSVVDDSMIFSSIAPK